MLVSKYEPCRYLPWDQDKTFFFFLNYFLIHFSKSAFKNQNSFYLQLILASISLIILKNLSLGALLAFLFTSELPFSLQK